MKKFILILCILQANMVVHSMNRDMNLTRSARCKHTLQALGCAGVAGVSIYMAIVGIYGCIADPDYEWKDNFDTFACLAVAGIAGKSMCRHAKASIKGALHISNERSIKKNSLTAAVMGLSSFLLLKLSTNVDTSDKSDVLETFVFFVIPALFAAYKAVSEVKQIITIHKNSASSRMNL